MIGYDEVNKGLKEVADYLLSIENVWNKTRNLKLYDVSFHASEIADKYPLARDDRNDLFYDFCQVEYDCFVEWMRENNLDQNKMVYIGRTSSFYMTDIHDDKIGNVITELLARIDGGYYSIDIDENGNMIHFSDTDYFTEQEQIENEQEYMEYIANGSFLVDVKKYLFDAVAIAGYIDSFKENQLAAFEEYVSCINDDLEYEREQEEKQEQEFCEKYAAAIKEVAATVKTIIDETACTIPEARHIVRNAMQTVTA